MIVKFSLISLLVIIILFSSSKMSYRGIWILNFACCIVLSFFAYHLFPLKALDIYRYYTQIDIAMQSGVNFILQHDDFVTLPFAGLYVSLFVVLGNKFLLPAVTCFIYYFFISSVVIKYARNNQKSKYGLVLFLIAFYLISNYLGVISGIRNPMAISLFCYILYKDLILKSNFTKCVFGYVSLCLFHPSTIILVIIRLLIFLDKKYDKIICLVLLYWTLLKTNLISFLLKISNNSFIMLLSEKLISYDSTEANAVANVSLYTIVYLVFYLSGILTYFIYKKYCSQSIKENTTAFNRFLIFLFSFCFGSICEYHMFVRFSRSVLMLLSVPIINIMSCKEIYNKNKIGIMFILFLESLAFLLFYMTGQYTSISFF